MMQMAGYYTDKIATLKDLFGAQNVEAGTDSITVDGRRYPVVDDVIVLVDEVDSSAARDIQYTFGAEWTRFPSLLDEHQGEFAQYFDLVDLTQLLESRVCDLGCGIGRWSYFLRPHCRELILVDFSDAIFVARRNLAAANNVLFFKGDLTCLPFRRDFADFIFSLGVLHHLPTPALDQVRRLSAFAPRLLIYLYYALDQRPAYFRVLLGAVTRVRVACSRWRSPAARDAFTWAVALGVYWPLSAVGRLLSLMRLGRNVPLADTYAGKSIQRIRQDVYDRFFTSIEQRFRRDEIMTLRSTFSRVVISDGLPYWHFLCER